MAIDLHKFYEYYGITGIEETNDSRIRCEFVCNAIADKHTCLEIGCAEGHMTTAITATCKHTIATDIAMSFIKRAKTRTDTAEYVCIDANGTLPFQDHVFDAVVITEVLEHTIAPYRVLEEIHRILKHTGVLILSVPNDLTIPNILIHVLKRWEVLQRNHSVHTACFTYGHLLKVFAMVGFRVSKLDTPKVPIIKRLHMHVLPQLGTKLMVVAQKCETTYWMDKCSAGV